MKARGQLTDSSFSLEAEEFIWDSAEASPVHNLVLNAVIRALNRHNAHNVLDLGCGNGAASMLIAQHGFDITGLDSSISGITEAAKHETKCTFAVHDLVDVLPLSLKGRFDAVIAIEVLEHLFRPRDLFYRASEALQPGGMLIVTTPYHGYLKNLTIALLGRFDEHVHSLRDFGHIKFFSLSTLRRIANECGFVVDRIDRVGRVRVLAKSMILTAHRR